MNYYGEKDFSEDRPIWQSWLELMIVLGFIFLLFDWEGYSERDQKRMELHRQKVAQLPVMWDNFSKDQKSFIKTSNETGDCVIADAVNLIIHAVEINEYRSGRIIDTMPILKLCKENFLTQRRKEAQKINSELFASNPQLIDFTIDSRFRLEFDDVIFNSKYHTDQYLTGKDFLAFLFWVIRWYFLFTTPCFLIIVLRMKFKRKKVLEEIILDPGHTILCLIFGPIGLAFFNDGLGARWRLFRKYERILLNKTNRFRLTKQEEDAIWLKILEPSLRLEESLDFIKQNPKVIIRKPLLITLMIGFFYFIPRFSSFEYLQMNISSQTEEVKRVEKESLDGPLKKVLSVVAVIVGFLSIIWKIKVFKICLEVFAFSVLIFIMKQRPRAPPATVVRNWLIKVNNSFCCGFTAERIV